MKGVIFLVARQNPSRRALLGAGGAEDDIDTGGRHYTPSDAPTDTPTAMCGSMHRCNALRPKSACMA